MELISNFTLQLVTDVALLMPVIGTRFPVCSNPNLLTVDSVMKLDCDPKSNSAQQMCSFPLQSLILTWTVANNTHAIGDSLDEWYVACTFLCCCDRSWLLLLCSWEKSIPVKQCVMPLSTYIASMRMTIFNHVFVTQTVNAQLVILDYFSSLDNCFKVLHCDVECDSLQTSQVSLILK